ncbi:MAG TPA: hypothetical protein PK523_02650 [Elusimicrobiales bacterium]|nr:hypothetical protein [Elusimicrobiales bacterium]
MFMKLYYAASLTVFAAWAMKVVNTDLALKKIPNAQTVLGFKFLLLALGVMAVNSLLGSTGEVTDFLNWNFYRLWAVHAGLSALAGLILWYSEVWPAGDAKFFMILSAWLPLINPFIGNLPTYLFLVVLINIFVAAALYTIGKFLADGLHSASPSDYFGKIWSDVKERFSQLADGGRRNRALAALLLANMTMVFLLQQVLVMESRGLLSGLFARTELLYFFMFFLWEKVARLFRSRLWTWLTMAFYPAYLVLGYFFFFGHMVLMLKYALIHVFKFSLILVAGRAMMEFLMEKKDMVYLTAAELEPGVVLSSGSARMLRSNPALCGDFDDCFKDGLDEDQVAALREWLGRLPGEAPKVETVKGRPFALWIFAGCCLTLLLDRNLAALLK